MPHHCITGIHAPPIWKTNGHHFTVGRPYRTARKASPKSKRRPPAMRAGGVTVAWATYLPAGLSVAALSWDGAALRSRFSRSLRIFSESRPDGVGVGVGFGVFMPLRYHRRPCPAPLTLQMSLLSRQRRGRAPGQPSARPSSRQYPSHRMQRHYLAIKIATAWARTGRMVRYTLSPLIPLRRNAARRGACVQQRPQPLIWPGSGTPRGFPPGPARCLRRSAVRAPHCPTRHSPSPN